MKRRRWTQEEVDKWNEKYPPGTKVQLTNDDGNIENTQTRSIAWLLGSGAAVVKVDGRAGGYDLNRIEPVVKKRLSRRKTTAPANIS